MANSNHNTIIKQVILIVLFLLSSSRVLIRISSVSSNDVHELLRSRGLPAGLVPKEVKSYTLSENGHLEVFLGGPCLTKFENRVMYESVFRANLSYGSLIGVVGLTQEELFLWLPVKEITVDDPNTGLIQFDIGVAHKQFSLSLFEDPPSCNPQQGQQLRNHVRKEKGFYEVLR
ncbi:uncharacterized protein [Rutidosis leptorrhynchoides]|uniref:uncharacterized protein n=1 Tax=Rutidosis leptorrhynchoides TaxID=125765 RepID=UPI003A9A629F